MKRNEIIRLIKIFFLSILMVALSACGESHPMSDSLVVLDKQLEKLAEVRISNKSLSNSKWKSFGNVWGNSTYIRSYEAEEYIYVATAIANSGSYKSFATEVGKTYRVSAELIGADVNRDENFVANSYLTVSDNIPTKEGTHVLVTSEYVTGGEKVSIVFTFVATETTSYVALRSDTNWQYANARAIAVEEVRQNSTETKWVSFGKVWGNATYSRNYKNEEYIYVATASADSGSYMSFSTKVGQTYNVSAELIGADVNQDKNFVGNSYITVSSDVPKKNKAHVIATSTYVKGDKKVTKNFTFVAISTISYLAIRSDRNWQYASARALSVNQIDNPLTNKKVVHFADENDPDDRLISIDYKNMTLIEAIPIEGSRNHKAHSMGLKSEASYLMLVPVESKFVTVRNLNTRKFVKKIRLPITVRSAGAYNKTENLMLATGRNRPASVLINAESLELVGKAGFNITCSASLALYAENDIKDMTCSTPDHGGNHVTGHGVWLDSKRFVILDRANRKLHIYQISKNADKKTYNSTLIQTLDTDTSLHTMHRGVGANESKYFYAVSESSGKNGNKPSGVYKYKLEDNGTLSQLNFLTLRTDEGKTIGVNSHHLEIIPDGTSLYVPVGNIIKNGDVQDGGIFVVNPKDMTIVKFISTGNGAAHVKFSKKRKMGIVTNRNSDYVTVLNYETHTPIKDISLNFTHEGLTPVSQAHTGYVEKSGDYYYSMWVDGGVFFRINLETLELDGSLYVGGTPFSGSYYSTINPNTSLPEPSKSDGYDEIFPDGSI